MTVPGRDYGLRPFDVEPYARENYSERDPNLTNFIENWRHYKDRITVFLGAGASIGARNILGEKLPTAFALRNEIWHRFMCDDNEDFDSSRLALMSLEHAAALAEMKCGATIIRQYVADRFTTKLPLWQHAVLTFLNSKAVFTPNYDNLIEIGWRLQESLNGAPLCETVFSRATMEPDRRAPIFKPHGSAPYWRKPVGEGGLVLTQFDYFEMLNWHVDMLKAFMQDFAQRCVVFVGYSFYDMDIASYLFESRKKNRGINWYAVFPRADDLVRTLYSDKYGIRQINRRFHEFLADLDDAVDFIPSDWKYDKIASLGQQGLIE